MNYTEIQLEAIKIFGRKDLTEGCIIYCPTYEGDKYIFINEKNIKDATSSEYGIYLQGRYARMTYPYEILGHEVHLEDLFRVAEEKGKIMEVRTMVYNRIELSTPDNPFALCVPYNPTLPLLDQPSLSEIISLLK